MAAPFAPRKQVQILGADGHPLPPGILVPLGAS